MFEQSLLLFITFDYEIQFKIDRNHFKYCLNNENISFLSKRYFKAELILKNI